AIQRGSYATITAGLVLERPIIHATARQFLRFHAIVGFVISADNARAGAPFAGAVLEMAMENVAPLLDAQSQSVARAPSIERVGIEKANESVPGALLDPDRPGGGQDIIQRFSRKLFGKIGRLGRGGDQAAYLPCGAAGMSRA